MSSEEFDSLSPAQQWEWILSNKNKISSIQLDNDSTYVILIEADKNDDPVILNLINDIGNRSGLHDLFSVIGINSEDV